MHAGRVQHSCAAGPAQESGVEAWQPPPCSTNIVYILCSPYPTRRYQLQVALRAAQKQLADALAAAAAAEAAAAQANLQAAAAVAAARSAPQAAAPGEGPQAQQQQAAAVGGAQGPTGGGSGGGASGAGQGQGQGQEAANARMALMEGALRQATADYQMLLQGTVNGMSKVVFDAARRMLTMAR